MTKRLDQPPMTRHQGTSLLELLGFLAVAALLIGGSLGLYRLSATTASVDDTHSALETTATRLKQYANGRDDVDLPSSLTNVKPPNGWTLSGNVFYSSQTKCQIGFEKAATSRAFNLTLANCTDILPLVAKKKVSGSQSSGGTGTTPVKFSNISW